jgi:hypothetical protein
MRLVCLLLLCGIARADTLPAPCAALSTHVDEREPDDDGPRDFTSAERDELAAIDASLDAGKARDPARARLERARIYFDADRFVDAAQRYCEVVVRHPRSPTAVRALVHLSHALMKLGWYTEVVDTVRRLCGSPSLRKNGEASAFCGDALL